MHARRHRKVGIGEYARQDHRRQGCRVVSDYIGWPVTGITWEGAQDEQNMHTGWIWMDPEVAWITGEPRRSKAFLALSSRTRITLGPTRLSRVAMAEREI